MNSMTKRYSNREMETERGEGRLTVFSFPKHVPPVSIEAENLEEAERKLAALDNKKEV